MVEFEVHIGNTSTIFTAVCLLISLLFPLLASYFVYDLNPVRAHDETQPDVNNANKEIAKSLNLLPP